LVPGELLLSLISFSWSIFAEIYYHDPTFFPSLFIVSQNRRAKCRKHENQLHKGEQRVKPFGAHSDLLLEEIF
jgi:hypothetical protein